MGEQSGRGSTPPTDAKSQAQSEPGLDSAINRHHQNHEHYQARNRGSPDGNRRADERRPQDAAVISRSSFRALVMMQCKIKPLGRKVNRPAGKPIGRSRRRTVIRSATSWSLLSLTPSDLTDGHSPVIGQTVVAHRPKAIGAAGPGPPAPLWG